MAPLLFLLLTASVVSGADKTMENKNSLANFSCNMRYTYVRNAKGSNLCQEVKKRYPMCKQEVQILFSDFPPYSYREERAKGILTDMISLIFNACCLGCMNLTYIGPLNYIGRYTENRTSIIIPIETSKSSQRYLHLDYIYLLEIPGVSFFVSKTVSDAEQMTRDLFNSVLATWPLFVTALLMAILAGFAVWALDTWFNVAEFPRSFLKGPFEGFWWAFVSMTTVGYGDRAPKSYVARIFAIVWIFLGITIFSMYSASLTTALTSTVATTKKVSVSGKRVGYLNTSTSGHSAALTENAVTVGYHSLENAMEDLRTQKIFAFALDDHLANYNMEFMKKKLPSIRLSYRVKRHSHSYGMLLVDQKTPPGALKHFFQTFFENNEDQREVIAAEAMRGLERADHSEEAPLSAFSHESPIFILTLVAITGIGAVLVVIGIIIHMFSHRSKKKAKDKAKEDVVLDLSKDNSNGIKKVPAQWEEIEEEFLNDCKLFIGKWKSNFKGKMAAANSKDQETEFQ